MSRVVYRFDAYQIDPAKRELWRGDTLVSLQPKAFDCLAYLIAHRDRAVGHDELIAAVWGKIDIGDNTLAQSVGRARQAVGDTGEEQRAIRTITRVGYSWILPIDVVETEPGVNGGGNDHAVLPPDRTGTEIPVEPPAAQLRAAAAGGVPTRTAGPAATGPDPVADAASRLAAVKRGRLPYAAAAAIVLLALAASSFVALRDSAPHAPSAGEIALVLPVSVVSDGSEDATWIRLGVMDLIADHLRHAGQAVVPSENTVALAGGFGTSTDPSRAEVQALVRAAASGLVIQAKAEAIDDRWQITLRTLHGREPSLAAQGEGGDVLAAARSASERMAQMLGHPPTPDDSASIGEPDLERLVQQIKAAVLSDQYDQVQQLVDAADPKIQDHPQIRFETAYASIRSGRTRQAHAALEALVRDLPASADPFLHAQTRFGLGYTHSYLFDHAGAEEQFALAAQMLESMPGYGPRSLLGRSLAALGGIRAFQSKFDLALNDFARARIALESVADHLSLASLDNQLGVLHERAERPGEALVAFARSAEQAQSFRAVQLELRARSGLARAHLALLSPQAALNEEPRIRELLAQVANARVWVFMSLGQVQVLMANGHYQSAHELLRRILDTDSSPELPERQTLARAMAAQYALNTGNPAEASREASLALRQTWDIASAVVQADTWRVLLRAQLALDRIDAAKKAAVDALAWHADAAADDPQVAIRIALIEAEIAAATGDLARAETMFERAVSQAEASGVPGALLIVAEAYVPFLLREARPDRASLVAGRVAGWAGSSYDAALLQLRVYHFLADATAWRIALDRARSLAGERTLPAELLGVPDQSVARSSSP